MLQNFSYHFDCYGCCCFAKFECFDKDILFRIESFNQKNHRHSYAVYQCNYRIYSIDRKLKLLLCFFRASPLPMDLWRWTGKAWTVRRMNQSQRQIWLKEKIGEAPWNSFWPAWPMPLDWATFGDFRILLSETAEVSFSFYDIF